MIKNVTMAEGGPIFSRIVAGVMNWGIWGRQLSTQEMLRLMTQCLELGVSTFDHADIYGHYTTEAEFGAALRLQPNLRADMQLVSKCGIKLVTPNRPHHHIKSYDTSMEHIIWSAEQSLKNLHTDYLDLLLLHRPDVLLHPHDVAEAFTRLRQEGKVRHFGVSNFTPSQFELLHTYFPLITNQVEANMIHLEPFHDGTFDQCLRYRLCPMVWSPLGGGALFRAAADERISRILNTAQTLANKRTGATPDQILLAWLLRHPAKLLPVLGTINIERIAAAVAALHIQLTREEWHELWSASIGKEVD
ncbi:MAG TPA: aldo/keto reductase [Saprospiraceae bacterium]|nr:aldo/keto reductase [Saprospiraceae bacterium]